MKSNHYLLTFNEDYADEHNVPALACMTTKEYEEWLETPSGDIDPEYDKKLADFKEACKKYDNYHGMLSKALRDGTREAKQAIEKQRVPYVNSVHDAPKRIESHLYASLGNGGDGFSDAYQHLYLMKEFVKSKIVKVTKVDESFYKLFHRANLSGLSLCNIFTIEEE